MTDDGELAAQVAAQDRRLEDLVDRLDRMHQAQRDDRRLEAKRVDALHRRIDKSDERTEEGFAGVRQEIKAVAAGTATAARNGAKKGAGQINWGNAIAYFIALVAGSAPIVAAIITH